MGVSGEPRGKQRPHTDIIQNKIYPDRSIGNGTLGVDVVRNPALKLLGDYIFIPRYVMPLLDDGGRVAQ